MRIKVGQGEGKNDPVYVRAVFASDSCIIGVLTETEHTGEWYDWSHAMTLYDGDDAPSYPTLEDAVMATVERECGAELVSYLTINYEEGMVDGG